VKTTTPSLNDQILALTNTGVSLEEAARTVLDSDKSPTAAPTGTSLSLEEEVSAAMYHGDSPPLELADQDDDMPMLPAVMIDKPTHKRVHELARKRHQAVHETVRGLVRSGLAKSIQDGGV
jgi:hypothetical protein